MTFDSREKSVSEASPLELFVFTGTFNTYRMTTSPREITNSLGTFIPSPVSRSNIENATQDQTEIAIDVQVPFDHPISTEYIYSNSPPKLMIDIYRVHRDFYEDYKLSFSGEVISFNVENRIASFRVPTIFSYKLNGLVPGPRYQAPCNHVLFDSHCGVNRSLHQITREVTNIGERSITVDSSSFADDACMAGEIEWTAGGQRRMIVKNTGNVFRITFPFTGLTVGQNVKLTKGCDHSFGVCKSKFSNGKRYGGTPLVPKINPFTGGL